MRWASLLLLSACLVPTVAADEYGIVTGNEITGTWLGSIPSKDPRRLPQDLAFQFVQNGKTFGGKQYGDDLSSPVQDGTIEYRKVKFAVVIREQAGNQVNDVCYQFEGEVVGNYLVVTRERASAKDSVSGAPVPVRRPNDTDAEDRERRIQTVRLERLF